MFLQLSPTLLYWGAEVYCNIQTLISVFLHIFLQLCNNSYSPDPNQAHIKAQFIVLRVPLDHLSPSHAHTKGHEVVLLIVTLILMYNTL